MLYHGAAHFSQTFFYLMGATVSNEIEKIVPRLLVILSIFCLILSNLLSCLIFVNLSLVAGIIILPGR